MTCVVGQRIAATPFRKGFLNFRNRSLPLRTVRVIISRNMSSGQHSDMWQSVLDYWFSSGDPSKWFGGGPQVDEEIKEKFGSLVDEAIQGNLKEWESEPRPSLALIILTDQFTRNIYRNTAKAFAGDGRALSVARKFIEGETHNHLDHSYAERFFMNMPFLHSENLEDQEVSVKLASKLAEDSKGSEFEGMGKGVLDFATRHKEVIDKFGRYPQRNKSLGRENTLEEEEFLKNVPDRYKW